jgi:hypothetical protein
VLAWIVDGHGDAGDWWSAWWDAEQEKWIDASNGYKVAGLVTHWCEPCGPGAWMENAKLTGPSENQGSPDEHH